MAVLEGGFYGFYPYALVGFFLALRMQARRVLGQLQPMRKMITSIFFGRLIADRMTTTRKAFTLGCGLRLLLVGCAGLRHHAVNQLDPKLSKKLVLAQ